MQHTKSTPLSTAIRSCTPAPGAIFVISLLINTSMLVSPLYSMQDYDRVLTSRNANTQWDPNVLGNHIGYLPQDVELFSGTVAENIAPLRRADGEAVIAATKVAAWLQSDL